jgi:hypothetical protein
MRARKGVGLDHRGDDGETRRVVEIGNDTSLASSENHRKTLSSAATKAGRLQRACLRLRDSPIKRQRATNSEIEHRRGKLFEVVKAMKPMTVRQVFYQATVRGIVEKSEAGYTKVQTDLVHMRRSGDLPYDWLADNPRWQRKPDTFSSVERALEETARFYRKALWDDIDAYAEIWLEKYLLSGVIYPITSAYEAADGSAWICKLVLPPQRGRVHQQPRSAGLHLPPRRLRPSGVNAGEKIEETLRELAPHLSAEQFEVLKAAEESERQLLRTMIGRVTTRGAS